MAQYPIAANVEQLRASIDALRQKMSDNLTSRGIAGVAASMTVIELADKVLEVKYKPLPSVSRSRARVLRSASDIDASLLELQEVIYAARVRLKLNLEVRGVTGLTHSDTLNQLADKILEIKTTPQYELYPATVAVGANGSFGEFYFNTKDAVKVDFSIDSPEFTLDRTTGQGAGNFIIRVTGVNNTTATAKTATVTVMLDNGAYPSETIAVSQAAGVQVRELVNPYLVNYHSNAIVSSIRARGGEIFGEYPDSVVFMYATYRESWNGVAIDERDVGMSYFLNLPDPFIVLTDGVTVWNNHLTAKNNTSTSARSATVTGYNDTVELSVSMVVAQDAGSGAYTFTGTAFDTLEFYANGTCKSGAFPNFTGFGATIRTYWNGIETASEYLHTSDTRCTIELVNNGGGFYIQAAQHYRQALFVENRTTTVGAARSCNVRCVYSEAGKGTFYSEYVTVTQDANNVVSTLNRFQNDVLSCSNPYQIATHMYVTVSTYTSGSTSTSAPWIGGSNQDIVIGSCGALFAEMSILGAVILPDKRIRVEFDYDCPITIEGMQEDALPTNTTFTMEITDDWGDVRSSQQLPADWWDGSTRLEVVTDGAVYGYPPLKVRISGERLINLKNLNNSPIIGVYGVTIYPQETPIIQP